MKTLVVASQKGGVGKTTLALNLGLAFAEAGYRVLLADTDPQGALGLSLSKAMTERVGLAECLAGEAHLEQAWVPTSIEGFTLLPLGHLAPGESHDFATAMADGQRLRNVLEQAAPHFDLTLVDTPCGFGGITQGALRNGDFAVSPIQAEPIAMRSVDQLLQYIDDLNAQGYPIRLAGLVVSMLQHDDPVSMDIARQVWDVFPRDLLFRAPVPRDPAFLRATAQGVPVAMLDHTRPPVTHVFDLLAAELAPRIGLTPRGPYHGTRRLVD